MKYNKFLTILFASGLLGIAVACTDNFEADNRNNTGFDSELQEYDFQKYLLKFEISRVVSTLTTTGAKVKTGLSKSHKIWGKTCSQAISMISIKVSMIRTAYMH